MITLTDQAVAVVLAADPAEKIRLSLSAAEAWEQEKITEIGCARPPERPGRPNRPELRLPRDMPKRGHGGEKGRVALLHALAHIELNAIDLAWDIIARFADQDLPKRFFDDWVAVARDEAIHHGLLCDRLADLGAAYGDLPAHDGLWEAALETAHDLVARLAVVPLVLEARGLDVTPDAVERLIRCGDQVSAAVLERIYRDEIVHVAAGRRWFEFVCRARGLDPLVTWHALVRRHFRGALKPPFNDAARAAAGFAEEFYRPLAG